MKIKNVSVDGDYNNVEPTMVTDFYEINEPLYILIEFEDGKSILVQTISNFMTDYMSIPDIFDTFIKKDEEYGKLASIVHDIIFNHKFEDTQFAADLMYEIMRYVLRTKYKRSLKRLKFKLKTRLIKRAVETRIAESLYERVDMMDLYNRDYSDIQWI